MKTLMLLLIVSFLLGDAVAQRKSGSGTPSKESETILWQGKYYRNPKLSYANGVIVLFSSRDGSINIPWKTASKELKALFPGVLKQIASAPAGAPLPTDDGFEILGATQADLDTRYPSLASNEVLPPTKVYRIENCRLYIRFFNGVVGSASLTRVTDLSLMNMCKSS